MIAMREYDDYIESLNNKFPPLSGGEFSTVYPHPTQKNLVVKVYKRVDIAYEQWAIACREHSGNPWLPVIHEHYTGHPVIGIVFMEKLEEVDLLDHLDFLESAISALGTRWPHGQNLEILVDDAEHEVNHFNRALWSKLIGLDADKLRALHSRLPEACALLKSVKTRLGRKVEIDTHPGNYMKRGDHQLVLIDPLRTKN